MAVVNALLTVSEFSRLPQPAGGIRQELHHGELFELPPVKISHMLLQRQLVMLLEACLRPSSILGAEKEFPFRPAPENQVWIADVAVFDLAAAKQTPSNEYFYGVPDIVIEVLSPSNTASEMMDREAICLRNGGKEFWLVDQDRKSIRVVRADGYSRVYFVDDLITSDVLGGSISLRELFKD